MSFTFLVLNYHCFPGNYAKYIVKKATPLHSLGGFFYGVSLLKMVTKSGLRS